jgi:hypothetical protein
MWTSNLLDRRLQQRTTAEDKPPDKQTEITNVKEEQRN